MFNRVIRDVTEIIPAERLEGISMDISILGERQSAMGAARLAYEEFL